MNLIEFAKVHGKNQTQLPVNCISAFGVPAAEEKPIISDLQNNRGDSNLRQGNCIILNAPADVTLQTGRTPSTKLEMNTNSPDTFCRVKCFCGREALFFAIFHVHESDTAASRIFPLVLPLLCIHEEKNTTLKLFVGAFE